LGFELIGQMGPAFAIFANGDLKLWLGSPQTSAAHPMPDGRKPQAGGWNRFVIEVDDVVVNYERAARLNSKQNITKQNASPPRASMH
jgi:hypothetical protein